MSGYFGRYTEMTHFDFNIPTTFNTVPIGGEFVECLTTCNEIATRIKPITRRDKIVNARRVSGKLIFMADWEPVFVEDYEDGHFYNFFWECPECEIPNSISIDDCICD
jgi:hypothetical protein